MRRILIVGNSGGGKSTLARQLGEKLGSPARFASLTSEHCSAMQPPQRWALAAAKKIRPP
jgi:deoxyadenosine/deoxycytidine kinase